VILSILIFRGFKARPNRSFPRLHLRRRKIFILQPDKGHLQGIQALSFTLSSKKIMSRQTAGKRSDRSRTIASELAGNQRRSHRKKFYHPQAMRTLLMPGGGVAPSVRIGLKGGLFYF
jgi:hypothetical protein